MTTPIRTTPAARKRQAGFTLFELIGVLALIAIAMYGLMRLKRTAEVNTNAESLRSSVSQIQQQAPNVYPGVFTGLTCATLANNDVFAGTSFRIDRSSPTNPVIFYNAEPNSQITCAPANVVNGTNDGYTLTFPGLSNAMCNAVADKLSQMAWLISVNGTSVKALRGTLNTDQKGAQCNASGSEDNQTIVASFTRALPPL
jgi:prepilin-type N-terminal cleavage/methylation domain-containing protein